MRTSQAARYARWAVAIAIVLAAAVTGVYAHRAWLAAQARRKAPPAVPASVQQRSAEFSFSKVEKDRTLFTVRASQATEFKDRNKSLLEDVWITIYGQQGGRNDNIHTRQCDYEPATGRIACQGAVQLDLESAEQAREHPRARVIHVETRNLAFNRETGEATTDEAVVFQFPYGQGRAVGVVYRARDATIRLRRDVQLTLSTPGKAGLPVVLTGGSLVYQRQDHTLRLLSPVRVKQGSRELTAASLALALDADLRARRAVATGEPRLISLGPHSRLTLDADQFATVFSPQGWAERVLAEGRVRGLRTGSSGENHLEAQRLSVEMAPSSNEPRTLAAEGNVQIQSVSPGRSQQLQTAALRAVFASGRRSGERQIERAETLAPATLDWKTPAETTRIQGRQLAATFDRNNHIQQLLGHENVEVERHAGAGPMEITSSQELVMDFGGQGEWSEVEQSGEVHFRQGDRIAQANQAKLLRSADAVVLSGAAAVADPLSRTVAQTLSFNQRTGEIHAEGGVRTSYFSAERNGITNLAPEPAHITADKLVANSFTGQAVYSGRARLWQGDAVIEADAIELFRDARRLEARGNVLADFPQAPGPATRARKLPGATESTLWRVRAASLTYWSAAGRAHLEGNVSAQSRQNRIDGRTMDLFLTPAEGGSAQLARATALGQVLVQQGDRRGSGERADYTAAEGKFVLSGGQPALYDASGDITTGRQLTFFLADDKILVDSGGGSRTVTRHRVEK